MLRTLRSSVIFGVIMSLLITACATTRLTAVWKDPLYHGPPRKIMVIGVAKKPINRRIFEDEFVRQLKARGTDAVASYTVIPDDKQGDNAVISAKMKEEVADAVLIARLASKKTVYTYIPGSVFYPPKYYDSWFEYYGYVRSAVYSPGYTVEDEYAVIETNLYDAGKDNLIWSASSETEIRGSNQDQIKSYIGVMVGVMAKQKLLR